VSGAANDEAYTAAIKTAVMPVIRAFETALNQGLLLESERHRHYFAFDTTELLKGDILKRYQAYQIGLANNFLQADEVRYKEDLKPLGFNFIRLGLQDVLLDPKTNTIYTPNTNQTTMFDQNVNQQIADSMNEETEQRWDGQPRDSDGRFDKGKRPRSAQSKRKKNGSDKSSERLEKSDKNDIIKVEIAKGSISLKINHEKQARHIKGTPEYIEGRSYLTISEGEAQNIINQKTGTGTLIKSKNGRPLKEKIDCDRKIGVDVDFITKKETPTDKATIHYSKTGTHLVPRKETKNE